MKLGKLFSEICERSLITYHLKRREDKIDCKMFDPLFLNTMGLT